MRYVAAIGVLFVVLGAACIAEALMEARAVGSSDRLGYIGLLTVGVVLVVVGLVGILAAGGTAAIGGH